jgi:hypothetical protein
VFLFEQEAKRSNKMKKILSVVMGVAALAVAATAQREQPKPTGQPVACLVLSQSMASFQQFLRMKYGMSPFLSACAWKRELKST